MEAHTQLVNWGETHTTGKLGGSTYTQLINWVETHTTGKLLETHTQLVNWVGTLCTDLGDCNTYVYDS
jgi:hypothetical protein